MIQKTQLRRILPDWRSKVIPAADALMRNLFLSADKVLFDYADKAESNAIQAKFIEGQREIRLQSTQVSEQFHEKLESDFFKFMRRDNERKAPGAETLSLVSTDAYERSLAIKTICDQALSNNRELYYALSLRLGAVTGQPAIAYEDIPAGPHQLAGAFESTARALNVERQVLLALYTLFEREVIRESPEWHEELNEALREVGILPTLKYSVKRDPDKLGTGTEASQLENTPTADPSGASYTGISAGNAQHRATRNRGPSSATAYGQRSAGALNRMYEATPGTVPAESHRQTGSSFPRYPGAQDNLSTGPSFPASDFQSPPTGSDRDSDPTRGTEGQTGGSVDPSATRGNTALGDQLLGRIRELLSARRAHEGGSGFYSRPDPVNPAPISTVAATISNPEIQRAAPLPRTGALDEGVRQVVVSKELLQKLHAALAVQRQRIKESVGKDKLSHFDEDTIDIVGMLFEVMLNDERLTNTVKALLSHLHTPYLKLAVRDRAFLKRRDHPARHLFDNMIEAGSRWVDESDLTKGIYPKLQRVVDLIMKAGDKPLLLLQELDEGLSAEIALRAKKQRTREARTIETEKGQARLEEARAAAVNATQRFLIGEVPVPFADFVSGLWVDYLMLIYLRTNGDTSNELWQAALTLCERLRGYIDQQSKGVRPDEQALLTLRKMVAQRLEEAIPHYETRVEELFKLFYADYEVTIVAASPSSPPPATQTRFDLSPGGKQLLKRLPNLPAGSWIVFHNKEAPDQTAKLSWFNPKTERFLFVDQAGAKALVVPLRKLADQIDKEQAHVLHATGTSYVESSLERALGALEKRA